MKIPAPCFFQIPASANFYQGVAVERYSLDGDDVFYLVESQEKEHSFRYFDSQLGNVREGAARGVMKEKQLRILVSEDRIYFPAREGEQEGRSGSSL